MGKRERPPHDSEHATTTWTAVPRLAQPSGKRPYLLFLTGPQLGTMSRLEPGRDLLLGRREDADVQIHDDGVSRRHATLRIDGEEALLTDLGSANGTWVDGRRAPCAMLHDGARIQVGGHTTLKLVWADELDARYQMKLAESTLKDALTGLYNRRHFDERLGAELAAAHRHARPLSLLMVDVDRFKGVNDAHGHLAGDEALKIVALVLRGAVRREDVLARYGGDEFGVIARETTLEGAGALGERIRRAVELSPCLWQGTSLPATVSVGATVWLPSPDLPDGGERALVAVADRALYLAKERGRNQVVALAMGGEPPADPSSP